MNKFGRFKQTNFRDWQLRDPQLLDILARQQQQLWQLARGANKDDAGVVEACQALDAELLHYACQHLRAGLDAAARDDCARLIAESVLDASNREDAVEHWQKWLSAATYWPDLASEQWCRSLDKSTAILIEQLESDGIEVDQPTAEKIEAAIKEFELKDLLPPELYASFFPMQATEEAES